MLNLASVKMLACVEGFCIVGETLMMVSYFSFGYKTFDSKRDRLNGTFYLISQCAP